MSAVPSDEEVSELRENVELYVRLSVENGAVFRRGDRNGPLLNQEEAVIHLIGDGTIHLEVQVGIGDVLEAFDGNAAEAEWAEMH